MALALAGIHERVEIAVTAGNLSVSSRNRELSRVKFLTSQLTYFLKASRQPTQHSPLAAVLGGFGDRGNRLQHSLSHPNGL